MKRRPSTQTNRFDMVATAEIPRSSFDLSHGVKTTFNASDLVPILSMEVLPGDSISCRAAIFARMATPLKPILDNLHCETFFFFTPARQLWKHWINMHGEQNNPTDSIDFIVPQVRVSASPIGSIFDYYGIPTGVTGNVDVNALPFRAYNHIYNNWFRDQNLVDSIPFDPDSDGPDLATSYELKKRRKRKDYFTGALPFPQKFQDVTVSLGDFAPVIADETGNPPLFANEGVGANALRVENDPAFANVIWGTGGGITEGNLGWANPRLRADLASATGISINDLRESIQIQRLLERDARGGTRYPELLRSHFGVTDPMMLVHQRPLFLGGGHTMVNINPIAQTSGTATDPETGYTGTEQGNLAAVGTIAATGHGFTYSATEHGYITGIINVRADLTYQQGLERYWSRQTRFDFFYPALGHLGEMAILNKEIYTQGSSEDEEVFGYQEAWADYRYIPSKITGLFRSSSTASLDVWHLAQDFANLPTLSEQFIEENVPMDRVVAVPSEPDFLCDIYFKIKAARPLPLYGTPGMMDHF